jgi:acyl carrier protein phosphodiesterase
MNFLAHQYLSFGSPPVMAGNFLADTLRGSYTHLLPPQVLHGVLLHRFIDSYTDAHPTVLESRKLLYPYFSKYAAVVQDVFYDHFLASAWGSYHAHDLGAFAKRVYATLATYSELFNERAARTYHYMSLQGWLEGYAHREGLHRAMSGLSRRARFPSNMENSLQALDAHNRELQDHFRDFFPALEAEAKSYYIQITHGS